MRHGRFLTGLIVLGMIAGALFGQWVLFDPESPIGGDHWTKVLGDLVLIRPLMLLIVPLVFVSVVCGVVSIGDPARLGVIGGATLLYYLTTMLAAVVLGAVLVSAIRPGALDEATRSALVARGEAQYAADPGLASSIERARASGQDRLGGAWMNIVDQLVPRNIVQEAAAGRPLGLIAGGIIFGLAIAAGARRTEAAATFMNAVFEALMILVHWVVWLTPLGVFLLVAWTVGRVGLHDLLGPLSQYIAVVLGGLAIHAFVVLPLVLRIFGRTHPYRFLWQMRPALMTALGTSSSSATLPVTIETAIEQGGVSKRSANFVLPLGATVNMDGTALYEAVAVVFLFQLMGTPLELTELLAVVITATLAAIGAAGIPSAGLVTMVIVVGAVNTSLEGRGIRGLDVALIGVIIGVDRILDMCRTTVNVWGDAVGAKVISRLAPDQ